MITRYAYVVNGETLWGPGPMPYFITLQDGSAWEITAHSREESEAVGIFVVEQINYKEFDDRFQQANQPVYAIVNGRPTETWSYIFIPAARENMLDSIDEHAETIRGALATKFPGQYAEYDQAYAEALAIAQLSVEATLDPADYPFVAADINNTYSPELERLVENLREASHLIITMRQLFKEVGAKIRKARFAAKKGVREGATDQDAFDVHDAFIATSLVDYYGEDS